MLRVSALEVPARWNARDAALADADALLARGPTCDLALLPEASLTGYVSPRGDADLRPFAEPLDGPTARALADLARAHRTAIAGPVIERDGTRFFNSIVVVDATGRTIAHYRKRHPWIPETWATRGAEPSPTFDIAGARVTICVCYDVHFVRAEAAATLRDADVLLFPSAWVEEDEDSRPSLLGDIARDFDIAIVNANWGLGTPQLPGQGSSMIIERDGECAALVASKRNTAQRIDAAIAIR